MHEEVQAKLADVERGAVILAREGGEIPGLYSMLTKLYKLNCLNFGGLFELVDLLIGQTEMLIVEQEFFVFFRFSFFFLNLCHEALAFIFVLSHTLLG